MKEYNTCSEIPYYIILLILLLTFTVGLLLFVVIKLKIKEQHIIDNTTKQVEEKYKGKIEEYEAKLERLKEEKSKSVNSKERLKKFIMYKNPKIYSELADIIIDEVFKMSDKYGINPIVIIMMIDVESDFNPLARAYIKKGGKNILTGIGLMQINPKVWLSKKNEKNLYNAGVIKNINDLYKPRENIRSGVYILNDYFTLCEKYKKEGRLNGIGFKNVYQCALAKYFGNNSKSYYGKVLQNIGEYFLYN